MNILPELYIGAQKYENPRGYFSDAGLILGFFAHFFLNVLLKHLTNDH